MFVSGAKSNYLMTLQHQYFTECHVTLYWKRKRSQKWKNDKGSRKNIRENELNEQTNSKNRCEEQVAVAAKAKVRKTSNVFIPFISKDFHYALSIISSHFTMHVCVWLCVLFNINHVRTTMLCNRAIIIILWLKFKYIQHSQ